MIPLWPGAAPVAIAYAAAARRAGLSLIETQLMSLLVYSAPAQLNAVHHFSTGASFLTIALSSANLAVHQVLYGVSLTRRLPLSARERLTAAHFLTDSAYGMTVAEGNRATYSFLLGAEVSMFAIWNLCTLAGAVAGTEIMALLDLPLDFAAPLVLFTLLVLSLRTWTDLLVAAVSGAGMFIFSLFWPGGVAILAAAGISAALGAYLRKQLHPSTAQP